jgi:hypothetical protein
LPDPRTRREWLKEVGAIGAGSILVGTPREANAETAAPQTPQPGAQPNGTLRQLTSSSDVFIPPRGRSFQKFSFDFPEVAVTFEELSFAFRIFTDENTYSLDRAAVSVDTSSGGLGISCSQFVFAGGQQEAPGRLTAHLTARDGVILCDVEAEMDRPVTAPPSSFARPRSASRPAARAVLRSARRRDSLGYPFSGGDLFGLRATAA